MNHAILIVEDEKEIADTLRYALVSEGMQVAWVSSGAEAHAALRDADFDLCILDVGLPDCSGFEFLKQLRLVAHHNSNIPVIFLTARSEEIDRVIGLEIGADDYVCKPFSPREVVARVKAVVKRAGSVSDPPEAELTAAQARGDNPFRHNPQSFTIECRGVQLPLTRAEYQLLATFLSQPGRVFSRRQLIENIWSANHPSDDRAIDTHIKTLRAKLKSSNPHQDFIITHRGFGYSLEL
ncbi:MAG: two-component system response regulator CreB [Gammaproteobacteria bacterium]|nr:two-component system response regulator CreB [Gammaproteobacteria bacterium]